MCSKKRVKKFIERQGQQLLFVVVSGIAPAKGDFAIGRGDQVMVGDGHAMGVTAEILQYILGATEGAFQVDHPILSIEWSQLGGEGLGLSKKFQVSMEAELAILKSLLESVDELAAKNFLQHFLGKKVVVSGANPASVI